MFRVQQVQKDDIEKIAGLEKMMFADAWSSRAVTETYDQKDTVLLAACMDGEPIGYVIVYFSPDEGEIVRIAVDETYRRQGAAGRLLLALEGICEERGIDRLMLEVRESNEGAISFYRDYGFEEDGIRKNFYENPSENAILMSRMSGR